MSVCFGTVTREGSSPVDRLAVIIEGRRICFPKISTNARAITSEGTVFWYCRCVEAASLRGTYGELRRC